MSFESSPSVLAFNRSIVVSDAVFYSDVNGDILPLHVIRHGIAGTQNVEGKEEVSNIQVTDTAKLHHDSNRLVVDFSLKFLPIAASLNSLRDHEDLPAFTQAMKGFISKAIDSEGLKEVASRYAHNILGGDWLWRNKSIASAVEVSVDVGGAFSFTVDADTYRSGQFHVKTDEKSQLTQLIVEQLRGENMQAIDVRAVVSVGVKGAEVFPSQLYVQDKSSGFARPLYNLGKPAKGEGNSVTRLGVAAIRDQKISNKLRSIDTWYPDYDNIGKAIAIEPMGANIEDQQFYRSGKDSAFSLLKQIDKLDPDSDDGMFMIATLLLRGGVYTGGKSKKKKEKAA